MNIPKQKTRTISESAFALWQLNIDLCFLRVTRTYLQLINAQHDVYHQPHVENWGNRPAYIFIIDEIYDNSATEEGFGNRVY